MKAFLLAFCVFLFCGHSVLAQLDLGQSVGGTPYDKYMGPMRQTYSGLSGGPPSVDEVRGHLRTARRFQYYFDKAQPYTPQSPEVTESRQQGDCKAKTLWMIKKMGDRSARYVIGRATNESKMSHAWLLWQNGGDWVFLDPTFTTEIIQADRVAGKKLFPQYSYRGGTCYNHPSYRK